jgi:nucleotide-binding universal stress UspA family protein
MHTGFHPYKLKKMIWAVDAFEDAASFQNRAEQVLGYFASLKGGISVEPVFVLNPNQSEVPPDLATPWLEEYRTSADEALKRTLAQLQMPFLLPHVVLGDGNSSLSQSIDILSEYALKAQADLILVNSHGRRGFKRIFLGSFAETLLHRSHVPVLVIGQKNKIAERLTRIIFPTEFGEHSKILFRQAVDIARQFRAEIHLLHVVPTLPVPTLDFDYQSRMQEYRGERVPPRVFREHQIEHQARREKAWSEFSRHSDVVVKTLMDTDSETVADAILKAAKQNGTGRIIMMEAQSSAIRDTIMGSTTKKVVRGASCPVWVLTSHYVEDLFKKKAA